MTGLAEVRAHSDSRQYCALLARDRSIWCLDLQVQVMPRSFCSPFCRGLSGLKRRLLEEYLYSFSQGVRDCMYSSNKIHRMVPAVRFSHATRFAHKSFSILHERNDQRAPRILRDGCTIFSLIPSYDNVVMCYGGKVPLWISAQPRRWQHIVKDKGSTSQSSALIRPIEISSYRTHHTYCGCKFLR